MAESNPIASQHNIEVYETMLEATAMMVGSYYESLIEAGIPDDLATKLTIDYHSLFWVSVMKLRGDLHD